MNDASDGTVTGDELRRWLDGDDDEAAPRGAAGPSDRTARRGWWVAAAVVPWVLVALAVAAVGGDDAPRPDPGAGAAAVRADGDGPAPLPTARPGATPDLAAAARSATTAPPTAAPAASASAPASGVVVPQVDDPGHAPPPAAAPVAVGLVRDAATTASAGGTTAVDTASAGRVEPLGDDTWLVRVHAVVLRGDRRRWRSARHEVWAAPVGRRGEAVVGLDDPWRVEVVDAEPRPLRWRPADGDVTGVRRALRAAGLPTGPDLRLQHDPALPAVVRAVTGVSSAWLRAGARPRVLGKDAR